MADPSAPFADCDVIVLAGGLGTRLGAALADCPKVLAPVGGRPYIAYLFRWLAGFGARRVILSLGHLAEKVTDYLRSSPPRGLEVITVVEAQPQGTAGALRHVRSAIISEPVLVINGDSFVAADLGAFLCAHRRSGAIASLLCVEAHRLDRYGSIEVDNDGRIVRFSEKETARGRKGTINAGVYLFNQTMLDRIDNMPGSSLERDILAALPNGTLYAFCGPFDFVDIGTPDALVAAAALFGKHFKDLGESPSV